MNGNEEAIKPFFESGRVAIAMSSSREYTPYLSVCLQSIKDHASPDRYYDIFVFERDVSAEDKNRLFRQMTAENISLRFINPISIFASEKIQITETGDYRLECLFRLAAPEILSAFDRVIFLDIDLVFHRNIAELYTFDIQDAPLACCPDLLMRMMTDASLYNWPRYLAERLKMADFNLYANTGVLVFNTAVWNRDKCTEKTLRELENEAFRCLEQDGLNKLFAGGGGCPILTRHGIMKF